MSAADLELTILMPCLNEAKTLETCIRKAQGFLEQSGVKGEIVVGDNGSTDGSQEIARRCGARLVEVPIRGYGAALYYAGLAARGKYVIMGDSDDSYDFTNLMPFLEQLRAGCDLVMGNRFLGGVEAGAMPWTSRLGNPIMSAIGRLFFHCPVGDFWCGLRGYSMAAFHKLDLRANGMEYALEMVIKATLKGLKVVEVPTTLRPAGRERAPHLRPVRDGWRGLRLMLLLSPRWLFCYPGLLLLLLGLAGCLWLYPGPRVIGNVRFDFHSLLYAAMAVLLGFQMLSFAACARVFAAREGMMPEARSLEFVLSRLTLEFGLALGALLAVAGLSLSAGAVWVWSAAGFGNLDPSKTLRLAIPSVLLLTLGVQLMITSFLLDLLSFESRRSVLPPKP